jgi:predicted amidohydrolase
MRFSITVVYRNRVCLSCFIFPAVNDTFLIEEAMKDLTIALVSMESHPFEGEQNRKKIADFTAEAARKGAGIICFPEAALTGYKRETAAAVALSAPEAAAFVQSLADQHGLTVLCGFLEHNSGGKPWVSQLVVVPEGREPGLYRKTHLGVSETGLFSEGDQLPVFSTPFGRIGIALCRESRFPEIAGVLALKGAEILFYPFASPLGGQRRKESWMKSLPARACDNTLFVGACNLSGGRFGGGALALSPAGTVIAETYDEGEGILFAELPGEAVNRPRREPQEALSMSERFYLAGRRPELYGLITTACGAYNP